VYRSLLVVVLLVSLQYCGDTRRMLDCRVWLEGNGVDDTVVPILRYRLGQQDVLVIWWKCGRGHRMSEGELLEVL